ncbi:MAG: L-threonylcarbamoyladenylate synthase [Bacteroidales bacterium]
MRKDVDINKAAQIIKQGGLVAFPTETVYGLGADATNAQAVARIFVEKERPSFDPLIVHIASMEQIHSLTTTNDNRVTELAKKFWPGPLTIVLPKSDLVPDVVTSGLPTVGIRMPDNEIALNLIEKSGKPIAAPSANKFGRISPTTANHVKKQLKDIDYILDGGPCKVGIESTVISLNPDGFVILREGFITFKDLEQVLPASKTKTSSAPLASPGLLKSHYSPEKPIYISDNQDFTSIRKILDSIEPTKKAAFISFTGIVHEGFSKTEFLSTKADLKEAAVNLFDILHRLEEDSNVDIIIAEPVPGDGIAKAIMDKLTKASFRYNN